MKSKIKKAIKKLIRATLTKEKYVCSVCSIAVGAYLPLPKSYKENSEKLGYAYFGQNEHLNVDQYSCPNCKSSDRDRFYAGYYKSYLKIKKESNLSLLHIAPAWTLNNRVLKKYFNVVTTDLMMDDVDVKTDIEAMHSFNDDTFDFIICSHVLEHVNHPDIALKEMLRILKKGGKAIIMAPINPNIENTLEDAAHITIEERIKNYGQDDHLRLFAKQDFIDRIKQAGFHLEMLGKNEFGERLFEQNGLRDSSILYVGSK